MMHTLYTRLAVTLALTLGLVGLVYALFMAASVRENSQYTEQTLNRDLAKTLVAERNLVSENELDEAALKNLFQAYMDVNPSIEIYLLDLQGNILSYSADPGKVRRTAVALQPIETFLKEDAMFPVLGDDPRAKDRQKVFSVTPIPSVAKPTGYLYVILRGEQYDQVEQLARDKQLLHLGAWVVGITLVVSLLLGLVIFYPLTRRLRILSRQVDAFRESGFKTFTDIPCALASDELSQLERNINLMSSQIVQQFKQISAQDRQRRDLFASLSHDLRTPLATLHTYLETLQMKATELGPDKQQAYIERAIQFSQRIKELVDELFEMAKLDTFEAAPHTEPFALPELVQDILQQFEATAQQQHVLLRMEGDTELPFVDGDISLIQRVFENLLANGLRHVAADDQITITLQRVTQGIKVQVSDSGCGMAEDELGRIFEPLYQINNAHRGGLHSGLGLAIVRRILELHASQISVSSILGKGTTFTFILQVDAGS